jgi:uncharacterized protein (DUF1330 family)
MSRSLVSFLLFLAVLLLAAGAGVWWLGPSVVELALDEDRRSEPYYLLTLTDSSQGGDYVRDVAALARNEGGEMLWRGGLERLLDGRVADEWQDAVLFRFSAGGGVVQMITSPEYRSLARGRKVMLVGSAEPVGDVATRSVAVLGLLESRDDDQASTDAVAGITARLADSGGALSWNGPMDVLAGDAGWNRGLLVTFADERQAEAWFRDPGVETERALARKVFERQAWLLLRAAYLD